jgi:diguanylate cyclase (GGDEF)-like protein
MGNDSFKRIFIKSSIATSISVAASVLIVATVVPAIGGAVDGRALLMSALCPFLIAYPASFFTFRQSEKLRNVHLSLVDAHFALADAHRKLAEKARRDDMTGMFNREAFLAELERSRRDMAAGTLLIVDADDFKQINDTHGHLTGDDALREIAAAITQAAGQGQILGRIGGEEFGVFIPGVGLTEAFGVAERVRSEVAAIRFRANGGISVSLTVSIGAALARREATLSDIMRAADECLYEAKRRGRNCVVVPSRARVAA